MSLIAYKYKTYIYTLFPQTAQGFFPAKKRARRVYLWAGCFGAWRQGWISPLIFILSVWINNDEDRLSKTGI